MTRRVKTVTSESTPTPRVRRTPERIVADLQEEIERVKARAALQRAKADPQTKALILAARALDKIAQDCAGEAKRALEGARALLCEQLSSMGIPVQPRRRKRQEAA